MGHSKGTSISGQVLRQDERLSLGSSDQSAVASHTASLATDSETGETPQRPAGYRDIARRWGCSPATAWRRLNRGKRHTWTDVMRENRFALVLSYLSQGLSIRRTAAAIGISRGAVERELRLARRLSSNGFDVAEMANRTIRKVQKSRADR